MNNLCQTICLLFILSFLKAEPLRNEIFALDLTDLSQFESFQDKNSAFITKDNDNVTKIIKFGELSKYSGIVTNEWITSSTGNYWIIIEFKGEEGKYTGAYLGYMRDDQQNIQKTIGLDAAYNMELYQVYRFHSNGDWNTYNAYLTVPKGVKIKLILEQGSYFGVTTLFSIQFKELSVWDMTFSDECPGTDKQEKFAYFTFLFANMELKNKVFGDYQLDNSSASAGTLKFQYPGYNAPCILTEFYAFDENDTVIESFDPSYSMALDQTGANQDLLDTFTYSFSMSKLENFNCKSEEIQCQSSEQCTKYTCPISFHFYYKSDTFNFQTKQQAYEYTKENSQAIFNSSFSVVVSKETVINTAIKVPDLNSVCTGLCIINTDIELTILMKTAEDQEYATEGLALWGQLLYFQITGADNYKFQLIGVITITEDGNTMLNLRQNFIDKFVKITNSSSGLLEFQMKLTGETEINPNEPCTLAFLVTTIESKSRILLENEEFPAAAIASQKLNLNLAKQASRMLFGIIAIIIIFIQSI